jgi:WXG100 family type VII secretion target
MPNFQITPEYLSQASASCNSVNNEVQEQLASLQQYVIQTEDWWQGIASNTFQNLMIEYNRCAAALQNALTGIANGLQGNWGNYTQNEQANTTAIQQIESGLPNPNLG